MLNAEKHFGAVVLKPAIDISCLTTGQLKEQTTLFGKNVWKVKSTFTDMQACKEVQSCKLNPYLIIIFCNAVPVTDVEIKGKDSERDIKERQQM